VSVAGFVDQVELHGETYQIQTELVEPARGRVRTVIFHAGRVVATNEVALRSVAALSGDPDSVREVVLLHHRHVVDGFVGRTHSFVERLRAGAPRVETTTPPVAPSPALDSGEVEMPPFPEDPALGDGLELRRLFGQLRRRIEGRSAARRVANAPTDDRGLELCSRLDRVAEALAWALEQPSLQRARVDEQVRFHLLQERFTAWVEHGRNPAEAEWIWTEVVVFCDYVSEISHRAELVDFDRRLVQWGLRALGRHGPSRATLKPLEWLFGRDAELDKLLASQSSATAEVWAGQLRRVWHRLGSG
jgi:hypothetical protein